MGGRTDFSLYCLENFLVQEGSGYGNCQDLPATPSSSWLLFADSSDSLLGRACDDRLGCGEV